MSASTNNCTSDYLCLLLEGAYLLAHNVVKLQDTEQMNKGRSLNIMRHA
jgi:hypothetical protein